MYFTKKKAKGNVYLYGNLEVEDQNGKKTEERFSLGNLKKLKEEAENDLIEFVKNLVNKTEQFLEEHKLKEVQQSDEIPDLVGGEIINLGVLYLIWFMKYFSIEDFLDLMQEHSPARYRLANLLNFCVGYRLFDPGSIRYECMMNSQWPLPLEIKGFQVYETLDVFYGLSKDIQHLLWIRTSEYMKDQNGQPLLLLFDGSNLYTFMRAPEEDILDPITHETKYKAFRTNGFSKENRRLPLVGLGLFVREGGIPISWSEQPGKRPEISYLPEELKKIMETFRPTQFILVADRGNWSGKVISTILSLDKETGSKNWYIIGKSVRKASKEVKQWAADKDGEFTLRYKDDNDESKNTDVRMRIVNQTINYIKKDGSHGSIEIPQMEIVRYSAVYARKEQHKRDEKIARAEKKAENPASVTQDLNRGDESYLEITVEGKDIKKAENRKVEVDKKKAEEEAKLDGLYLITTNMIQELPDVIIRFYKDLKFAEQDFRILKSDLLIRPFYVKKKEHICAVMDFSVFALYALRVFQAMLKGRFTTKKILRDIKSYAATREDDGRYRVIGKPEVIKELEKITGVGINHRYLSQEDITEIFTSKKEWMKGDPYSFFSK